MNEPKLNKIEEFASRLMAFTAPSRVYRLHRNRPKEGEIAYAHFNDRAFASIIDIALCLFLFYKPMYYLASMFFGPDRAQQLYSLSGFNMTREQQMMMVQAPGYLQAYVLNSLMQALILGALFVVAWSYSATTPGKFLLRMRIVDEKTGCRPTHGQCVLRFIGTLIAAAPLMLGMLWIAFDKKRQGWHDKIAGTVVVKVKHWRLSPPGVSEYPPAVLAAQAQETAEDEDSEEDEDEQADRNHAESSADVPEEAPQKDKPGKEGA